MLHQVQGGSDLMDIIDHALMLLLSTLILGGGWMLKSGLKAHTRLAQLVGPDGPVEYLMAEVKELRTSRDQHAVELKALEIRLDLTEQEVAVIRRMRRNAESA